MVSIKGTLDSATTTILQRYLNVAAYLVDYVSRKPPRGAVAFSESTSSTRRYDDVDGGRFWYHGNILVLGGGTFRIDDLLTATEVKRGGYVLAASDYILRPYNEYPKTEIILTEFRFPGDLTGYRTPMWGTGLAQFEVTGTWGYCAAADRPPVIKEAVLTQAERMYERMGLKARDLVNSVRDPWKKIDPFVLDMLESAQLVKSDDGTAEIVV
jgi:hypothetical protein